jgi:hypothetical protein
MVSTSRPFFVTFSLTMQARLLMGLGWSKIKLPML